MFIYDAIMEFVACGDTEIDAGDLRMSLENLKRENQFGRSQLYVQCTVSIGI